MFVQGRAKWIEKQMSSLLEQMLSYPFGERSDHEKPEVFRGSARHSPHTLAPECPVIGGNYDKQSNHQKQ